MWPVPESVRSVLAGERDAEVQRVLGEELAKGGIINPATWRVIDAGPDGCFIPIPAEARKLETVRVQAILMKAASETLMGGANGDK